MALKNVLTSGTYGLVTSASIDKTNKNVQFRFEVFSDETKSNLLFERDFFLACSASFPEFIVDRMEPNGTEQLNQMFFVPMNATGSWAQYAGMFLQVMEKGHDASGNVVDVFMPYEAIENTIIKSVSGKIYKINSNKNLIEIVVGTIDVWNAFFAFDISTASNTNLIKQCYAFLKTIPLCSGAVDA